MNDLAVPFELQALSEAKNVQKWMFGAVSPYLGARIMELGAGIGNMTSWLPRRDLLLITEADDSLIRVLKGSIQESDKIVVKKIDLEQSFLDQVASYDVDTIVSFNVMEHIEKDEAALREQIEILKRSKARGPKRIVHFVPAHPFLFGSFDRAFHHFRRYRAQDFKRMVNRIDPKLKLNTHYFNLISMPAWFLNGRVLKKTSFDPKQIQLMDRIVPLFSGFDHFMHKVLRFPFGQSLIVVIEV